MSFDKNQYEKQALAYLTKGNNDKALEIYGQILRADPKDRRIRQKIAELYHKMGKTAEAEKQFREVVRLYTQDGNHRAAVAVIKQLLQIKPRDAELIGMLAEAYQATDQRTEAEKLFEQAINALASTQPEKAAGFAESLLRYRYGDTALKIRRAELLKAANKLPAAYEAYRAVIEDMRRRGKMMEVGRIAAAALEIKPDADDLIQDAAESAIAQGDHQTSLRYLQTSFQKNPRDARTLELLARSFQMASAPDKARHVLLRLAGVLSERGDHAGRLAALERAAEGGADPALQKEIDRARAAVNASEFRLFEMESAAPKDDSELRVCTRAEVFLRYGFADRARPELDKALGGGSTPGLLACAAEVAVAQGDKAAAQRWTRALMALVSAADKPRVEQRLAVLEGRDPAEQAQAARPAAPAAVQQDDFLDDEPLDDAPLDEGPLLDDEPLDDPPADDLLDEPELEPLDDDDPFGGLDDEDEPPPSALTPPPLDDPFGGPDDEDEPPARADDLLRSVFQQGGTFAEVDPADMPLPGEDAAAPSVDDAAVRGLIRLGLKDQVHEALAARGDLAAAALRAQIALEGEEQDALYMLRDQVDEAGPQDPGYPEALFALASLSARTGKYRAAARFLDQLSKRDPKFRPQEVAECRAALEGLSE